MAPTKGAGSDFPLAETNVLIGRSVAQAAGLMNLIQKLGGTAQAVPLIEVIVKQDSQTAACLRTAAARADVLVATSANALRALQPLAADEGIRLPPTCYVIGEATSAEATVLGYGPVLFPEVRTAKQLAQRLVTELSTKTKIFFPHGNLADGVLPRLLEAAHHEVISCECYTTQDKVLKWGELEPEIGSKPAIMVLYSPSAVRSLRRQVPEIRAIQRLNFISVGPTTAAACEEYGLGIAAMAEKPTDKGVLDALIGWAQSRESVEQG